MMLINILCIYKFLSNSISFEVSFLKVPNFKFFFVNPA